MTKGGCEYSPVTRSLRRAILRSDAQTAQFLVRMLPLAEKSGTGHPTGGVRHRNFVIWALAEDTRRSTPLNSKNKSGSERTDDEPNGAEAL